MVRATVGGLLVVVAALLPAAGSVGASARTPAHVTCTDSWQGGSGSWSDKSDWSTGQVPGASDDVCITASGTYTVTLGNLQSASSLTLGGASGTQTLLLLSNATLATELTLTAASTINANGVLELSSTQYTTYLRDTTIANDGTFETAGSGSFSYDELYSSFTNDSHGSVVLGGENVVIPNNTTTTNDGRWMVDTGTDLLTEGGAFVEEGTIENLGTMTVESATFDQVGGGMEPLSRPVQLLNSALDDTGGTLGSFEVLGVGGTVAGTVQPKQQVLVGVDSDGETTLKGSVVNRGLLLLAAPKGDFSELTGGRLTNEGHLELLGSSTDELRTVVVNGVHAVLGVHASTPVDVAGRIVNDGLLQLGRGTGIDLEPGTLISGPSSVTEIVVDGAHGCPHLAGGHVTLAGTLSVAAVGGTPSAARYVLVHGAKLAGRFLTLREGRLGLATTYTVSSLTLSPGGARH